MNTKVTWIDTKRLLVETPLGDDFVIGFSDSLNYQIEQQSVFKVSDFLSLLFDNYLLDVHQQLMRNFPYFQRKQHFLLFHQD